MAGRRLLKFPQVVWVQRVALQVEAANKAAVARAYMEGLFADTSLSRTGFSKPSIAGSSTVVVLWYTGTPMRARAEATFVTRINVRASHFTDSASDIDGVCRLCGSGEKESLLQSARPRSVSQSRPGPVAGGTFKFCRSSTSESWAALSLPHWEEGG